MRMIDLLPANEYDSRNSEGSMIKLKNGRMWMRTNPGSQFYSYPEDGRKDKR